MDREDYMSKKYECEDFWSLDNAEELIMLQQARTIAFAKADLFFMSRRYSTNY